MNPKATGYVAILFAVLLGTIAVLAALLVHSSQNASAITATNTPAPTLTPRDTATPRDTPTPRNTAIPTATPKPTNTPFRVSSLNAAQQLAYIERKVVIPKTSTEARRLNTELMTLQAFCGGHQYELIALVEKTWHNIHTLDHLTDSIGSVTAALTGQANLFSVSNYGDVSCSVQAGQYVAYRSMGRTMKDMYADATATAEAPTQTPEPTETPVPPLQYDKPNYRQVNDHPDVWQGTELVWTCNIAKFLGPDPNSSNQIVGCWDYSTTFNGGTGNGEVILNVNPSVDVSTMDTGDDVVIAGTVDVPFQGTNGFGAVASWPQVDVTYMKDNGHDPNAN